MKQNMIELAVSAAPDTPTESLKAGRMYEHNATALCFVLEEALVSTEYRYYVHFSTASGETDTAYLKPDKDRKITVSLSSQITSNMTAICELNIVKVDADSSPAQIIKPKTVRLYFALAESDTQFLGEDEITQVQMTDLPNTI